MTKISILSSGAEIEMFLMKKSPKSNEKAMLRIYAKNCIITCFSKLSVLYGTLNSSLNGALKKQYYLQKNPSKYENVK